MATDLQVDLAKEVVKNRMLPRYKRKNKQDLVVSVGYSPKVANKKATEIIEAKGVQETIGEMLEAQGLTEDFIKKALVDDIIGKPKRRERELRLGAEILGITEHDKGGTNKTLIVIIAGQSANRYGVATERVPTSQDAGGSSERPAQI